MDKCEDRSHRGKLYVCSLNLNHWGFTDEIARIGLLNEINNDFLVNTKIIYLFAIQV